MTMKIENYETYKAGISADTFTFPYNSNVYDDATDKFMDQKDIAYAFSYFGVTDPLKSKRAVVINGHFSEATRLTDYQALQRNINDNKIKKFYFSATKFMIVFGVQCKRTQSGTRPNFVDYVASFISPFGILFSDTQKADASYNAGWTNGVNENEGDVPTPIEYIEGTVSNGVAVTIETKDGDGFIFTPTATGTVKIYLIYLEDVGADNFFTTYLYADIAGTKQSLKVADNSSSMFMKLDAGQTITQLFTGGSTSIANIVITSFAFRDGYSSD